MRHDAARMYYERYYDLLRMQEAILEAEQKAKLAVTQRAAAEAAAGL